MIMVRPPLSGKIGNNPNQGFGFAMVSAFVEGEALKTVQPCVTWLLNDGINWKLCSLLVNYVSMAMEFSINLQLLQIVIQSLKPSFYEF